MPLSPTTAQVLERLASDLHSLAFDCAETAWSVREAERRHDEVERICTELRATVRGGGCRGEG